MKTKLFQTAWIFAPASALVGRDAVAFCAGWGFYPRPERSAAALVRAGTRPGVAQ